MKKSERLDNILDTLVNAFEDLVVIPEELEKLGRVRSAENLREILTDIECLRYDLRNTNK